VILHIPLAFVYHTWFKFTQELGVEAIPEAILARAIILLVFAGFSVAARQVSVSARFAVIVGTDGALLGRFDGADDG